MEDIARRQAEAAENMEQLRQIELDRLDRLQSKLDPRVKRGEPQAILAALRVCERRAKMTGLDAAIRAEISGPGGIPVQVQQLSDDELRAQLLAAATALETPRP